MSYLTTCQPGWLAVFEDVTGNGFTTEPIACWLNAVGSVHPICALGGDIVDATLADNYVGVVGPSDPYVERLDAGDQRRRATALYESWRTSRRSDKGGV